VDAIAQRDGVRVAAIYKAWFLHKDLLTSECRY
jgi:hypothetical protein